LLQALPLRVTQLREPPLPFHRALSLSLSLPM
jgi:hypothetical protein